MVTGFDLCNKQRVAHLRAYVERDKPYVIIMGLPCRVFANWSRVNRHLRYETLLGARHAGQWLAFVFAELVCYPFRHRRHFIVENPAGSEICQELDMVPFIKTPHCGRVPCRCSSHLLDSGVLILIMVHRWPRTKPSWRRYGPTICA